jgi:hypothetical protein
MFASASCSNVCTGPDVRTISGGSLTGKTFSTTVTGSLVCEPRVPPNPGLSLVQATLPTLVLGGGCWGVGEGGGGRERGGGGWWDTITILYLY